MLIQYYLLSHFEALDIGAFPQAFWTHCHKYISYLRLCVLDQVAVYDYIWTADDPSAGSAAPREPQREGAPLPEGETSTHVAIFTLYLSGMKQRYRHFLRQPDGVISEVGYQFCIIKLRGSKNVFSFYCWIYNKFKVVFG